MSFASLRLVLQSTGVAARALSALASIHAVFPGGQAVVDESLRTLSTAMRTVDHSLTFRDHCIPILRPARQLAEVAVEEVQQDRRSRDPALIQQEILGSKTLLLEVVRRAAYDWVLYRTSRRFLNKKLAEDAYVWLFVESPGHANWIEREKQGKSITSFLSICSELDLDVEQVRMYVRRLTVKNVMSVGRPAEYRRRETCVPSVDENGLPALSTGSRGWEEIEASYETDFESGLGGGPEY